MIERPTIAPLISQPHRFLSTPFRRLALPALACFAFAHGSLASVLPSFPGAEGAGADARGGRWGRVIQVTNLQDSGPGSFRAAVESAGPRMVVFEVSGVIHLQSPVEIDHPYLTVAGQTAPGSGICIAGETTVIAAEEIVIRHLRFRCGRLERADGCLKALSSPGKIMIDHCSFRAGEDEDASPYRPLPAPVDTDRDGMPDAWERRHNLDASAPGDSWLDADKDGYTNLEEYLNQTDPQEFVDYKDSLLPQ